MSITFREFELAMKTFEAKPAYGMYGYPNHQLWAPNFNIAGTYFVHSGTFYIIQEGTKVPDEVMDRAMAEFGEKHPGGDNFWWGEIHSVKGMLTLAAMLENKYSKELVDDLTNKAYKNILDCPAIQKNIEFSFYDTYLPKKEELYKLLDEFSNIVNPFGNSELKLKDPIQYLNTVNVSLSFAKATNTHQLTLSNKKNEVAFKITEDGWAYNFSWSTNKNGTFSYIAMGHYYSKGHNMGPSDEIVWLCYKVNEKSYDNDPGDIDLRISLKTGLAWRSYEEKYAAPVTNEQIDVMITHLKFCINEIRNKIICNMIDS